MMKLILLVVVFGTVYSQVCRDRFVKRNCDDWKNRGLCRTSSTIRGRCPKTCGVCGGQGTTTKGPTVCRDGYRPDSCNRWKNSGYCKTSPSVKRACAKTCGLCGGQGSTTRRPIGTTARPTARTTAGPTAPITRRPTGSCGISQVKGRVIAGQSSKQGQWPWQIAMLKSGRFACGGSLIDPYWVVTAAHCVSRGTTARSVQVVLGDLDRNSRSGLEQTIQVAKIISHSGWRSGNKDIALLKLSRPAILNDNVQTVCLPRFNDHIPVGTKCFITGWGKTRHPGSSSTKLQHASLEVISNTECHQTNKKWNPIQNESICARNKYPARQSGCHGDSGGPFVCQGSDNRWTLHGAVSWGSPRCDIHEGATVFARISALRDWIDEQMQKN